MGNFTFLAESFPALEKLGSLAEDYLYSDSNTCIYKLGALAETVVNYMMELDNLAPPAENTPANRIKALRREGLLPSEIGEMLYSLRTQRNLAVHEGHDSFQDAALLLRMGHTLSVWFMQAYGDRTSQPQDFTLPQDTRGSLDYERLLAEKETLAAQLAHVKAAAASSRLETSITSGERRRRSARAVGSMRLTEAETRALIDEQLRRVGWEADTQTLRYGRGVRPEKGRNLAIAEWPTDATACKWGHADYALFAGPKLVGVIEAKARHTDVSGVVDNQAKAYAPRTWSMSSIHGTATRPPFC